MEWPYYAEGLTNYQLVVLYVQNNFISIANLLYNDEFFDFRRTKRIKYEYVGWSQRQIRREGFGRLDVQCQQIQDDVLKEILTLSANTEYLRPFLHKSSDKELFKKNVPVTTYDDVKLFIDLVANGEPFDVISGKPITGFSLRYTL